MGDSLPFRLALPYLKYHIGSQPSKTVFIYSEIIVECILEEKLLVVIEEVSGCLQAFTNFERKKLGQNLRLPQVEPENSRIGELSVQPLSQIEDTFRNKAGGAAAELTETDVMSDGG
ncbi:hypothetical protein YC2023_101641 [Brassica napus]